MRIRFVFFIFSIFSLFSLNGSACAWHSFYLPRLVAGGGVGYFRISLNEFYNLYSSKWDVINSGHVNVRIYRSYYLTVQYESFKNDQAKKGLPTSENPVWQENFYNVGVRMYRDVSRKWNFYSGLGLTFAEIKEKPNLSVFPNNISIKFTRDGQGFFLELGADYVFLPHLAFLMEIEITSVGEGGSPAIAGQSLGGFAFQVGMDFYF